MSNNFRVLTYTEGLSEDEWLEHRKVGIGGSDIAAIAGFSEYKNAITVYLDKIGQAPPKEVGEAAYWGHRMETLIADEFALRSGKRVETASAILQHPELDWMIGDLDRVIVDKDNGYGVLECKNMGMLTANAALYNGDDEQTANEHMCQMQWYMGITGWSYAYLAGLVGGNKYVERRVERDEEIITYLKQLGAEFWEMVQNREMPAIDGSDESSRLLNYLYLKSRPESIELTGQKAELAVKRLQEARDGIARLEVIKQTAENELKSMMGEYQVAFCLNHQLSWKPVTTTRFQQKEFEKDDPETYAKYCRETKYRRFLLTRQGGLSTIPTRTTAT